MDLGNFDANNEQPISDFQVVPADWYKMMITGSDEKSNKKNTGTYLQYDFSIVGGQYDGAPQLIRLNLNNPSEKAVAIAKRQLGDLARAAETPKLQNSEQLHDKVVYAKVIVNTYKRDDGSQGMSNEVKKFEPNSFVPPKIATVQVAAMPPVPAGEAPKAGVTNSMPWDK